VEASRAFLHRVGITLAALFVFYFLFFGKRPTPIFNFLQRLERDTLDMRFTYRPASATPADPRMVMVQVDLHSQEVLGRWLFSRSHFAKLPDLLKEDGAKTMAFDVTFRRPDQTGEASPNSGAASKSEKNVVNPSIRTAGEANHHEVRWLPLEPRQFDG